MYDITRVKARGVFRDITPEEQASNLEQRAARAAKGRLAELIAKAGSTDAVLPGDEIPDDWIPEQESRDDITSEPNSRHGL